MPFLPLFIRELGVSDVGEIALWTGATLGVTPALTAILSPFWGRIADRVGRKLMVVRALLACMLVMTAVAFVNHPWQVLALRAVMGLFTGYGGLALTMAAESAPRDRMASAIGQVQTAQRLGPALGPAVGGLLAGWLGLRPAFLMTAVFYAIALVLVVALYDERALTAERTGAAAAGPVTFRSVFAFENFPLLMVAILSVQFVDRTVGPVLPLYLEQLGVQDGRVAFVAGLLFSLTAVAAAVGHHACGGFLQRWDARQVISAASATTAAGGALFAVGTSAWLIVPAAALFGAGAGTAMTAAYTAAGSVIPPGAQGAGFGLLTSASLVGLATSPVVAGLLGAASLRAVFVLDVLLMAILSTVVQRMMTDGRRPSGSVQRP
jgi:DHA1 family multidrug resistance protein-like MFS transporter